MATVNTTFLAACRGESHDRVPVWFMNQTGYSIAGPTTPTGTDSLLDTMRRPELVTEFTLEPVRRIGVDAAVLHSDIMIPVAAIGFGVDVVAGVGPVVEQPFRSARDLTRLRPLEPDTDTPYVAEAIRLSVHDLDVPLIGIAGGPFSVATHLIEGRRSHPHAMTKALMHSEPELWHHLMDLLTNLAITSLRSQVLAGASAVQIIDPWIGTLGPADFERFVLPHSTRLFGAMADMMAPRLHFGVGTGELLGLMARAGSDVVGIDWRVPIDSARERVGPLLSLQGNLDPAICLAPWDVVAEVARDVLERNAGNPAYVFNVGHDLLPGTDPGILEQLVALVHEEGVVNELDDYDRTGDPLLSPNRSDR